MITLRGQILVSRKLAIRDDPNIRLRCSRMSKTLVLPMKTPTRVSIQNIPVCTFKTSQCIPAPRTHVSTCARGAGIHGDVFNKHTGFFSVSHHRPHRPHRPHTHHRHHMHSHTQHTTTTRPQHLTKTERERERQGQTETERDRERRQRQKEKRRDKRREKIHF